MNSRLLPEAADHIRLLRELLPRVDGILKRHQEGPRRYTLEGRLR
jgi:hypothetical protein